MAQPRHAPSTEAIAYNFGGNERSGRTVTVDSAVGNDVVLDLGHGRFAVYAHLQPGSIMVRVGDHVRVGQVLALLGNSGNSDAPHLHFHLVNANSPMGAEGIPYELTAFRQMGILGDSKVLDAGEPWRPQVQTTPTLHRREFPSADALVTFP